MNSTLRRSVWKKSSCSSPPSKARPRRKRQRQREQENEQYWGHFPQRAAQLFCLADCLLVADDVCPHHGLLFLECPGLLRFSRDRIANARRDVLDERERAGDPPTALEHERNRSIPHPHDYNEAVCGRKALRHD